MRNYDRYYQQLKVWGGQPKVKVSGLISLTIFTVAFFLSMAILPTFKTIGSLSKEIKDQQEVVNQLTKKISSLETAETNYAQVMNDLKSIDRVLPETEELERLAWQIQWLAQQKGVEITSGSFGDFNLVGQKTNNDLRQLLLDLSITGNYQQIKAFLQGLTTIDRLISIENVVIGNKDLKDSSKLTASLKLAADYLPKGESK